MMKTVIISFVLVIFAANVSSQERNVWAEVIGYLQAEEFSGNLYKEYTSLKSRELEELPRFRVMSWQPS